MRVFHDAPIPVDALMPAQTSAVSTIDQLRHGPIVSTLLRLSAPNVLAMTLAVLVGIAETFYVGRLGTTQLAAFGLIFPFAMLTGMMSAGAMGGGVSSAIARAIGADNVPRATALAMHAFLIGAVLGIAYSVFMLLGGPTLYRWLGGEGAVLEEAQRYAFVLFSGAICVWMCNTLASIVRGTGNMRVPSAGLIIVGLTQIVTGGALALGLGPIPSLGLVGVALGNIIAFGSGSLFFLWYLASGQGRLHLRMRRFPVRREMLYDILRVGALSCLSPLQSVLTMLVFTSLLARLGEVPLAGYSIGLRLEFLCTTVSFGIGVASVPMVGMAIGGGDPERARRVAWAAALVAGACAALIGLTVAVWPWTWADIFSKDEEVLAIAYQYLRLAGPAFPFLCGGLTLYFSSQGAGKMLGPVIGGTVRFGVAFIGGFWLASRGVPAWQYFVLSSVVMVAYAASMVAAVRMTPWGAPVRAQQPAAS